ncbi:hypothetical protein SAMN04488168_1902 [Bacillus sp. 491mf]|nr:hypothetical protein SAMN04488168_1902 [Bacillus sp. 491mf]
MQGLKQREKANSGYVVLCIAATYMSEIYRLVINKRLIDRK